MKRIALAVILLAFPCLSVLAQQPAYFLFIQSDDSQPFYVRTQGKVYSSSSIGHLVIAGCKDTIYPLSIGFPGNRYPEQFFTVSIHKKDHGYLLKNENGQNWSLVNWQSQESIHAIKPPAAASDTLYGEKKNNDAFAQLMSGVVNDTAVLYASVKLATPINKPADPPVTVKKDPPPAIVTTNNQKPVNKDTAVTAPVVKTVAAPDTTLVKRDAVTTDTKKTAGKPPVKPVITRISEADDEEGKKMTFADISAAGADTISIIIPFEKAIQAQVAMDVPAAKPQDTGTTTKVQEKKDTPVVVVKNDPPPVQQEVKQAIKDTVTRVVAEPPVAVDAVNKTCRNFATDQDVDKLRIKMMDAITAYERTEVAKKILRIKCYSTQQIKALSELFANDEGLYRFLETAYPNVSDPGRFRELSTLLRTEEYANKFKKMVK